MRRVLQRILATGGVLLIIGGGVYAAIDAWLAHSVVEKAPALTLSANNMGATDDEGGDEREVTPDMIDEYRVSSENPRVLYIEKLGLRARILPMGLTEKNAIQAPVNIFDSGWYTGSTKPGTEGISFIDAHASGATRAGLFAYVDTLTDGDTITVERGDGELFSYEVRALETRALDDIDMAEVLRAGDRFSEGLVLMTCTGAWIESDRTYDQRVIVYAKRV